MSNVLWAIAEDKNGDIWSTDFYGASKFNGDFWSTYTVEDGLGENYSWAIENDSEGNVWFAGVENSVITMYDGSTFHYYSQPANFEECIYNDSQGNMWFGSWNAEGIAKFDGNTWTYFMNGDIDLGTNIYSIGEDANGNILVSLNTDMGPKVIIYDGSEWNDFVIPGNSAVVSEIYFDTQQNTWFTTEGKFYKFDGVTWHTFTTDDGTLYYCQDISEDIYGNIWFGGVSELVKFDGNSWTKYTANDGMAAVLGGGIYAVHADSQGNIWVGTFRGGISKYSIPDAETCTTLEFETGWNLFSTPVVLDSARIGYSFQPLVDNGSLIKIQDELGNAYEDPGVFGDWDDSQMKLLRPYDGFKINMSRYDSVQLCGAPVTYPYPIYLYTGWNIIGYPQSLVADAQEVVQQLINRGTLLKVQSETGSAIEDLGVYGGWTNFIGNFYSGEGYKVKVNTNDTLWIYETYPKSSVAPQATVEPLHFARAYTGNGVDHMNINIVDLPVDQLRAGDELAVYNGNLCVGAITLMPQHLHSGVVSIAVSAADNYGMPGFNEGNTYELRLWNAKLQSEQILQPDILKGPVVFTKHESAVLSLKNYSDIELGLIQNRGVNCYPNPFTTELIIEAGMANAGEIDIRIVNQVGQQVNQLVNKQLVNAGLHRYTWDGTNGSGQKAEPGMYYIRVSINENLVVHKVVMTK
jgi:streptogramin lyase